MKKATLALAGLMAVASAAQASWARWNGFGASNAFIADVADIWTLPGVVASNPDATYGEFNTNGTTADDWGGVHVAVGPGVLGIWGNRPFGELSNINGGFTAPSSASAPALLTPANQIDILYGFKLSDTLELGVGVSRLANGNKIETTTAAGTAVVDQQISGLGINVGAEVKGVGPFELLEIGVQYDMGSATSSNKNATGTVNDKVSASSTDIDVRVGGDIKGDSMGQRVELGFNTDALNLKDEPTTALPATAFVESKNSASAWNLGWAMNKSSDKGMGLGGLMLSGLTQSRTEDNNVTVVNKFDNNVMTLALVAAGEAKATSWLTARAGISSNLYQSTQNTVETGPAATTTKVVTSTPGAAGAAVTGGLSFIFGSLVVDTVFNQTLVAGAGLGALLGQVAATYGWGGGKE
jgi:hypothetical protein